MWPGSTSLPGWSDGWLAGRTSRMRKGRGKKDKGSGDAWLLSLDYSWPGNLDIIPTRVRAVPDRNEE
jgi:hypothetical protein